MDNQNAPKAEKTVTARRRLFQILAVGGTAAVVLPEKWVKPVVDAVIVPAHAAGSVTRAAGIFGNTGPVSVASSRQNPLERLANMLVSSAHATAPICGPASENVVCISFDIQPLPSTSVQVYVQGSSGSTTISANNAISNVTVGNLVFSNLIATSTTLSCLITSSRSDCTTGFVSLQLRETNFCVSG
jgi:hypothetical protein